MTVSVTDSVTVTPGDFPRGKLFTFGTINEVFVQYNTLINIIIKHNTKKTHCSALTVSTWVSVFVYGRKK